MEKKTGTFKSLDGKKYKITGFTRMMAIRVEEAVKTNWELNEKRPLPKQPTYKLSGEDVFGEEEVVFYHTEDTLYKPLTKEQKESLEKNPALEIKREFLDEVSEEEKKAWLQYQDAKRELDNRVWKQMMYEAMNCVQVPMKDLKEFVAKKRRDTGLALPNPEEYEARVKRIYVEEIVLCDDTDEMMRLLTETMQAAGVISEGEAKKALESFRGQEVEQSGESAKRSDTAEQAGDS